MKQTKKLTYSQRKFLEKKGYKDTSDIRFCRENSTEFICYDTVKDEVIKITK